MFTTDAIIDAVQNGKKTFVKTFFQNETMADSLTILSINKLAIQKKQYQPLLICSQQLVKKLLRLHKMQLNLIILSLVKAL